MDFGFTPFTVPGDDGADGLLQPLEWGGLCARLAAEGDLRRALAEGASRPGAGSFALGAATALAGAWPVNRDALANGKGAEAKANGAGDAGRADLGGQE
jgi:hypothetical protein